MFEVIYNVGLLVLWYLFPWVEKENVVVNKMLTPTMMEKIKAWTLNVLIWNWKYSLFVLCFRLTFCAAKVGICIKHFFFFTWWQMSAITTNDLPLHRSVEKIIFWLHGHIPRDHNIHVVCGFEHHGRWITAEWGFCVVIASVHHTVTVRNVTLKKHTTSAQNPTDIALFFHTKMTYYPKHVYFILTGFFFFQPFLSTFLACLLELTQSNIY